MKFAVEESQDVVRQISCHPFIQPAPPPLTNPIREWNQCSCGRGGVCGGGDGGVGGHCGDGGDDGGGHCGDGGDDGGGQCGDGGGDGGGGGGQFNFQTETIV